MTSPTAVVTGAASGIGLATARLLRDRGWRVAVVDLSEDVLRESHGQDGACLVHAADIGDPDAVRGVFERAERELGPVRAVANVAGISLLDDQRIEDVTVDVFDQVIRTNLRGTFLMCRAAIPALRRAGGGAIVNVGSLASLRGVGGTSYVASKSAIAGLGRAIAAQYATEGIRCNTVAPGATDTPMLRTSLAKSVTVTAPSGVIPGSAQPAEVAELIAYLFSDAARFVTGTTLPIDGGASQH